MATIGNDPNGFKRILFVAPDRKRKTIRLGKAMMKQATAFKVKVEALIGQTITGVVDDEVSRWLSGLDAEIYGRLAAVGLVKPRGRDGQTLGALIDGYIAGRAADAKPRTLSNLDQASKRLVAFFGVHKPIRDVTEADAEEFYRWQIGEGLAPNTVRRTCGRAKQFFRFAVRKRLIPSNPFADLKTTVGSNPERKFFVTADMARKVLDACPDAEWRLIFALCRYGGLRCPSEVLALRWGDIDWERSRSTIRSAKTEHHEGKDRRVVPIFPELLSYLADAFDQAQSGQEFVIARFRGIGVNLRTQLERILGRAGRVPWPKLFHNLRASRQTELAERYPIHVVCAWLGNSTAIASEHYLQVTEAHYNQAAQIPAQSAAKRDCQRRTGIPAESEESTCRQELALSVTCSQELELPPRGLRSHITSAEFTSRLRQIPSSQRAPNIAL
jgi:integrase